MPVLSSQAAFYRSKVPHFHGRATELSTVDSRKSVRPASCKPVCMSSLWQAQSAAISGDAFTPGQRFDVVVLGAGLTGLVSAVLLARAGKKVGLLEARTVGAVTTGNTTAKLSLLHGAKMATIVREHGPAVAQAYASANRAGQQWLVDFCEQEGVPVERRDAFTYCTDPKSSRRIEQEVRACLAAGLAVESADTPELPFRTHGAVRMRDQYQFQPMDVLAALAGRLRACGGTLVTELRATSIRENDSLEIVTEHGTWFTPDIIVATGFPAFQQHGLSGRLEPHRSYAIAVRTTHEKPRGMYLALEQPTRSLRTARGTDEEYLLVGGQGHVVGREDSAKAHVAALLDWTVRHFGEANMVQSWSAQDYGSLDQLPLVLSWKAGRGRAFLGTGFDKWGMTNGTAAALAMAGRVLASRPHDWEAPLFERSPVSLSAAGRGLVRNGKVGLELARGWGRALVAGQPTPAEGEGMVVREGLTPIGVCRLEGRDRRVSAVCTHLGGILRWNDAELSWDCPLHGSRFSPDGSVLEGPARCSLRRH
jgi:glycine/D-amino acid oxidase-like deaminating enzyme/nitrite reductase/ring-hydroxylating ferredoxin subunit